MKYILKYNSMHLLMLVMILVVYPTRSFLVGLWYKVWGFPSEQQHLDHFAKMPQEELDDFIMHSQRPKNLAIIYSLVKNAPIRESQDLFYCISSALTTLKWGFEFDSKYCEYIWTYSRIESEAEYFEYIDLIRGSQPGTAKRALIQLGISEEVLNTFRSDPKNCLALEKHCAALNLLPN